MARTLTTFVDAAGGVRYVARVVSNCGAEVPAIIHKATRVRKQFAVGIVHLALVAAAPLLLGAGEVIAGLGRNAVLVMQALTAVAVLAIALSSESLSRRLSWLWPSILGLTAAWQIARGIVDDSLAALALTSACVAIVLSAAGCQSALSASTSARFEWRGVALATGEAALLSALALFAQGHGVRIGLSLVITGFNSFALLVASARLHRSARAYAPRRIAEASAAALAGAWFALLALIAASTASALLAWHGSAALGPDVAWRTARSAARLNWACSLVLVSLTLGVFARRMNLAGAAASSLRQDSVLATLSLVVPGTLLFMVLPNRGHAGAHEYQAHTPAVSSQARASLAPPPAMPPPTPTVTTDVPTRVVDAPSAANTPVASNAGAGPLELTIDSADGITVEQAQSTIEYRSKRLLECLSRHPGAGSLSARLIIELDGSVSTVTPTGGDLLDSDLGKCLVVMLYRVGFAPHSHHVGKVGLTLHVDSSATASPATSDPPAHD